MPIKKPMKSEKEKLSAKSVTALKATAKRLGGKLVAPDGKAKTKQQLINTIVMKQRLAGKSMGGNAKPTTATAKLGNAAEVKKLLAQQKKLDTMLSEFAKALDKAFKKA
jgi:hypothetical protein